MRAIVKTVKVNNKVVDIGIGGFEISYDPKTFVAKIVIRASVQFKDGIVAIKGFGALENHDKLRDIAKAINIEYQRLGGSKSSEAEKYLENAVKPYQWKPNEKALYLKNLENVVEMFWDKTFVFTCTTEFWEDLTAITRFFLELREGQKLPTDHVGIKVYKVPAGTDSGIGQVEASCRGSPTCNLMELDSNATKDRSWKPLQKAVKFSKSGVDGASIPDLKLFAETFAKGTSSPPKVTAKVPGKDLEQAKARFEDLKLILQSYDFDVDRLLFEHAGKGNTGTLIVGRGERQVTAAHEFGHMLGLDDEYATVGKISGTGGCPGTSTGHANVAYNLGFQECDPKLLQLGPGCAYENNEDVMSLGNMLRPIHGTPFIYALKKLTNLEWKYVTSQVEESKK